MSTVLSREEALFAEALALSPAERGTFLAKACGSDFALLKTLIDLIAAHETPHSILTGSAVELHRVPEETPGDVIGHYTLRQRIGEGGCGVVWLAEQEEPVRRRVALKVIKLGMDTKAVVARFEAERQALAMMDHPNIAKVYDAGSTATGRPFFVMELVRGIPITKYCDENHLTPTDRLDLFIKVCQAVQHAHQKGIIHRDLKPSNILVTVNDGAPTPKVIDFGIAKATQGRLTDATVFTAFEQFIGTPVYMSPEQAEMSSLDIDTRTDVYSLGILLYELLTGRTPFDPKGFAQAGVDEIRRHIRQYEPPKPSARWRTLAEEERTTIARLRGTAASQLSIALRGDLDWIVMRCIEKDRTRRYETANGIAADIQRHLRNEPVTARPPSTAYLIQKLIRRHRLGFAAAATIAIVVVVGAVFSAWQAVRAKRAEAIAREAEQLAGAGRTNAENLLSFVFTDIAVQLSDYGQSPIARQLSQRAVSYYESLPPKLQTRDTRANYAFVLAASGSQAKSDRGRASARVRLERALEIFEKLEATGPLTPLMRVGYAEVCGALAGQYFDEGRRLDGVRFCERGEQIIQLALSDEQWGTWARRQRTALVSAQADILRWAGQSERSLPVFERALALAVQDDRDSPGSVRNGLRAAQVKVNFALALANVGRLEESLAINEEARGVLRQLVEREPFLASARASLGMSATHEVIVAQRQWRFQDVAAAVREAESNYEQLRSLDPTSWSYRGMPAWWSGAVRYRYHWQRGEFAAAESAARKGVELWAVESAPPGSRPALLNGRFNWARVLVVLGREAEAEQQLAAATALRERIDQENPSFSAVDRLINWASDQARRRVVELERLNWAGMRANAELVIRRLPETAETSRSGERLASARRAAHADVMRAAFESGDYAAARRELDRAGIKSQSRSASDEIQQRFNWLGNQLTRVEVLARAGERQLAQAELEQIWPEVEAVFAAGPDYLFNEVQTARALSIRAEIAGTSAEKRQRLERAAGYLRSAAVAGKLTRYEREVLLAAIENQLAALTMGTAASVRP